MERVLDKELPDAGHILTVAIADGKWGQVGTRVLWTQVVCNVIIQNGEHKGILFFFVCLCF